MTGTTTKTSKIYWISIVFLLLIWETASIAVNQEIIIPSIFAVGRELFLILTSRNAWTVILWTMSRIIFTFFLDLILALAIGIPAGIYNKFELAIRPMESAVRTVPTMGIILLSLIWLDSGLTPVFVSSLIIFPILYRSVVDGIHNIDKKLIDFHKVHQIHFSRQLKYLYIPSMFPFLKTGTITSLGLGFKVMITAEVLSQPDKAIGTVFQIERAQLNTAAVMAWCVFMIAVSSLFEHIIQNFAKLKYTSVLEKKDETQHIIRYPKKDDLNES